MKFYKLITNNTDYLTNTFEMGKIYPLDLKKETNLRVHAHFHMNNWVEVSEEEYNLQEKHRDGVAKFMFCDIDFGKGKDKTVHSLIGEEININVEEVGKLSEKRFELDKNILNHINGIIIASNPNLEVVSIETTKDGFFKLKIGNCVAQTNIGNKNGVNMSNLELYTGQDIKEKDLFVLGNKFTAKNVNNIIYEIVKVESNFIYIKTNEIGFINPVSFNREEANKLFKEGLWKLYEEQIKPLFKVGDRFQWQDKDKWIIKVLKIEDKFETYQYLNSDAKGIWIGSIFDLNELIINKKIIKIEPIFKTEDGVEVFEGDKHFGVTFDFDIVERTVNKIIAFDETCPWIFFSTKELAEKYIEENKKQYSLNDVNTILSSYGFKEDKKRIKSILNSK